MLSDETDKDTAAQADNGGTEHARYADDADSAADIHATFGPQPRSDEPGGDEHEARGAEGAEVQGHLRVSAFLGAHHEGAQDGGDDTDGREDHGQQDGADVGGADGVPGASDDHGADDGADVGLEEVCSHASHVTHVVTDVVGDNGRIAGVIFGKTGFDFTNQVGTDIGGLGVDTTAHTSEQRDGRSAHGEASENGDDTTHLVSLGTGAEHGSVEQVKATQTQQGQTDHRHTHHSTAGEGDLQSIGKTGPCSSGGTDVGRGGHAHTDVASQARATGTNHEGKGDQRRGRTDLHVVDDAQQDGDHSHEDGEDPVLGGQEGHGTLTDGQTDLLHLGITGILFVDPLRLDERIDQRQNARSGHQVWSILHDEIPSACHMGQAIKGSLPPRTAKGAQRLTI